MSDSAAHTHTHTHTSIQTYSHTYLRQKQELMWKLNDKSLARLPNTYVAVHVVAIFFYIDIQCSWLWNSNNNKNGEEPAQCQWLLVQWMEDRKQATGRHKKHVECNKTFITLQLMEFEMLPRKIFVVAAAVVVLV